jgi:hypothetical protein
MSPLLSSSSTFIDSRSFRLRIEPSSKSCQRCGRFSSCQEMVAGVGFEPTTYECISIFTNSSVSFSSTGIFSISSAQLVNDSSSFFLVFSCALIPGISTNHPIHHPSLFLIKALYCISLPQLPQKRNIQILANFPGQFIDYFFMTRNRGFKPSSLENTMSTSFSKKESSIDV